MGQNSNNPMIPGEFHAFPSDFKMLHGDIKATEGQYAINHKCILPEGGSIDSVKFPENPEICARLRGEITFPSCWDGKNSDSADHKSHMTYPENGWAAGKCPDSHPVRVPTLFFEAEFMTFGIAEPGDSLVYSYNDWEGYGFHGDFLNGWKDGAIDQLLYFCTFNEDLNVSNCGLDKSSPYECDWEGNLDDNQFKGPFDELPPWN